MKTLKLKPVLLGALLASLGSVAQAVTPFDTDVAKSIDDGLNWMDAPGHDAYKNPSDAVDAAGLAALALLEKRNPANPTLPGYLGATAADQQRMREVMAYILSRISTTTGYSYRDGANLMALVRYAQSGGPDIGGVGMPPAGAPYVDLATAIRNLTDRFLPTGANPQNGSGYWCYGPEVAMGCSDSSTTQFAVAGLNSAKSYYNTVGTLDPARVAAINAALATAQAGYVANAATGSDNGSCSVVSPTERGHGYNVGYVPSLQQTASGTWVQLLGLPTPDINNASVQNYLEWSRNHYRYTDLDAMGNFWPGYSYWYYLWSSFKGMEFVRQSGILPLPGNLGPDDLGTRPNDGTCNTSDPDPNNHIRQFQRDPAALPRVPLFGSGAAGYYYPYPKGQYFDYAYSILGYQCADGSYSCNGAPGSWNNATQINAFIDDGHYASQSYAILVLLRATGVDLGKCDLQPDGSIDKLDINQISRARGTVVPPGVNDRRDADNNRVINSTDVKICIQKCTLANCAVPPAPAP